MSKPLLQQLYDGEVYPAENINPKDPEYREAHRKISAEKEYFKALLSADERERFSKLDGLYFEASSRYGYECYTYGFRLGVSLMIEALDGRDELVRAER